MQFNYSELNLLEMALLTRKTWVKQMITITIGQDLVQSYEKELENIEELLTKIEANVYSIPNTL